MRLTYKKLCELTNEAFIRVGVPNYEAFYACNPRFNGDQIAGGAPLIVLHVRERGTTDHGFIISSRNWSRLEWEVEINKGAVIGFEFSGRNRVIKTWADAKIKPIYLTQPIQNK